jgi:hypothetical protein
LGSPYSPQFLLLIDTLLYIVLLTFPCHFCNSFSYLAIIKRFSLPDTVNVLFVVDVCPLINHILSEATYEFQNHCAMKCLQYPLCAGYNFKKKHQKKTPNCQLTHTLDHNFHDCNADDKGWIFYHPVAPRKVQNCSNNI